MKNGMTAHANEPEVTFSVTVEPDGRIVLPESICEKQGWREGTVLRVSLVEDLETETLVVVLSEDDPDASEE